MRNAQDKSGQVDAKKLVGKWKVTGEKGKAWFTFLEFKADGKMIMTADAKGKGDGPPCAPRMPPHRSLIR